MLSSAAKKVTNIYKIFSQNLQMTKNLLKGQPVEGQKASCGVLTMIEFEISPISEYN